MGAGESREWLDPWRAAGERAATLDHELRREICPSHPLFGVRATAVGLSRVCDDVLFALAGGRFALVHLTYRAETTPEWPHTVFYATWGDWLRDRMAVDHDALRS